MDRIKKTLGVQQEEEQSIVAEVTALICYHFAVGFLVFAFEYNFPVRHQVRPK